MGKKSKKKLKAKKDKLKNSSKKKKQLKTADKSSKSKKRVLLDIEQKTCSSQEFLRIDDNKDDILSLNPTKAKRKQKKGKKRIINEVRVSKENIKPVKKLDDPVFKELATPTLPKLANENRAKLLLQSPTKIYFYWSIKNNPFKTLNRVFGDQGNYSLVVKFINKTKDIVEFYPIEAEGNWWFDTEANSLYQTEIGFYAPNRPFIRIMFSNEVQTPRKSPSKRKDLVPHFDVSANQFAEVLDVSGYKRDAVEVALAGDDFESAQKATAKTYFELVGKDAERFSVGKDGELRFVLLALASGHSLNDIESEISSDLFTQLEIEKEKFGAKKVFSALKQNFDLFEDELFEEIEIASTTFGASLVNFQKTFKKRSIPNSLMPKLSNSDTFSSLDLSIR